MKEIINEEINQINQEKIALVQYILFSYKHLVLLFQGKIVIDISQWNLPPFIMCYLSKKSIKERSQAGYSQ